MFEANPNFSQRQIAAELGISIGKANYCIKAVIDRGWVKTRSFRDHNNKLAYSYVLTSNGIRRKAQLAMRFLEHRRREFEDLKREIAMLDAEIEGVPVDSSDEP